MSAPSRFLARWSRLKRQDAAAVPASVATEGVPAAAGEENLLPPDVDLTALLREEISEAVRRQALKKIFADPHFNVMDGLDVYIDDYSVSDPIPPEMMATLRQARMLLDEDEEEDEAVAEEAPAEMAAGVPARAAGGEGAEAGVDETVGDATGDAAGAPATGAVGDPPPESSGKLAERPACAASGLAAADAPECDKLARVGQKEPVVRQSGKAGLEN
ncbi:MAG: hypothetical protein BGO63_12670 [Candidatus Accumulibacter sp. 66-26]|nr:MAG: hypothetical protein BGO63_12670 [Candidatus Accumulibacter sp. 66-26]